MRWKLPASILRENKYLIRLAKGEDIGALTDLHIRSFHSDDHIPVMLGRDYVRATYRWLVNGENAYALVAEEAWKIIGLVAVCDGPFTGRMFKACLPELLKSLILNPKLLLNRRLWRRLFQRSANNKLSRRIVNCPRFAQMTIGAVDENYRGHGVFPALVDATKYYSRERGSRAIRAGVYKNNHSSRRVFIKGGWLEISELETVDVAYYVFFIDSICEKEIEIMCHLSAPGQRDSSHDRGGL